MFKEIGKMDKKAKTFLFFFLHIIFFSALTILIYGICLSRSASGIEVEIFKHSGNMTIEYLLLSLCECIGGALFLDYIFRKSDIIS